VPLLTPGPSTDRPGALLATIVRGEGISDLTIELFQSPRLARRASRRSRARAHLFCLRCNAPISNLAKSLIGAEQTLRLAAGCTSWRAQCRVLDVI